MLVVCVLNCLVVFDIYGWHWHFVGLLCSWWFVGVYALVGGVLLLGLLFWLIVKCIGWVFIGSCFGFSFASRFDAMGVLVLCWFELFA